MVVVLVLARDEIPTCPHACATPHTRTRTAASRLSNLGATGKQANGVFGREYMHPKRIYETETVR